MNLQVLLPSQAQATQKATNAPRSMLATAVAAPTNEFLERLPSAEFAWPVVDADAEDDVEELAARLPAGAGEPVRTG